MESTDFISLSLKKLCNIFPWLSKYKSAKSLKVQAWSSENHR